VVDPCDSAGCGTLCLVLANTNQPFVASGLRESGPGHSRGRLQVQGPPEPTRPPKVHLLFERADSRPPTCRPRCCREQPVKRNAQGMSILSVSLWVPEFPRSLASDQMSKIRIDNVLWDFKRATPVFTKLGSGQNARCLNPDLKAEQSFPSWTIW